MPITLLDLILIGIMLISGLLAMIRGFIREVLSIAAWVVAALVTLYSFSKLLPFAKSYFADFGYRFGGILSKVSDIENDITIKTQRIMLGVGVRF